MIRRSICFFLPFVLSLISNGYLCGNFQAGDRSGHFSWLLLCNSGLVCYVNFTNDNTPTCPLVVRITTAIHAQGTCHFAV